MQYVHDPTNKTLTLMRGGVAVSDSPSVTDGATRNVTFRMTDTGECVHYTIYGMLWSSRTNDGPMNDTDTVQQPMLSLMRTDTLRKIVGLFADMFGDIFDVQWVQMGTEKRKLRRPQRQTMHEALGTLTDMMTQAPIVSDAKEHSATADAQNLQVTQIISALMRNIDHDQLRRVLAMLWNDRPTLQFELGADYGPNDRTITVLSGFLTHYTAMSDRDFTARFVTPSLPMMMLMTVFRYVMAVHSVTTFGCVFNAHVYGAHILLCNIRDVLTDRLGYTLFQEGVNKKAKELMRDLRTTYKLKTTTGTAADLQSLSQTDLNNMRDYVDKRVPGVMVMPYVLYYHMHPQERFRLMYDQFRKTCMDAGMPSTAMGTSDEMWHKFMCKLQPSGGMYSPSDCIALLPMVMDMQQLQTFVQSTNINASSM